MQAYHMSFKQNEFKKIAVASYGESMAIMGHGPRKPAHASLSVSQLVRTQKAPIAGVMFPNTNCLTVRCKGVSGWEFQSLSLFHLGILGPMSPLRSSRGALA
mmetsp:Transcript_46021/g.85858  ORF Transcript_46021/g.85858 Transcript_46021/m.85858 type:complete len:102 (-) Transcript_46021:340-645(-)